MQFRISSKQVKNHKLGFVWTQRERHKKLVQADIQSKRSGDTVIIQPEERYRAEQGHNDNSNV
jgi:hypothetical protein